MMRTTAAWLVLCAAALAQITVPAVTDSHMPIVAVVTAPEQMPEGATFDGGWKLEGAHYLPDGKNRIHIWAKPGEYKLEFSGLWLHLKDVTFTDGAGQEITITSYLGHGFIDEQSHFKVAGGTDPDPEPDPTPGPSGPQQLVFFVQAEELDKLPQGQREILTSLVVRKDLEDQGHLWLIQIDDDQIKSGVPDKWKSWIESARNADGSLKDLPRVSIAPKGGGPIADYPLPNDYTGLLELLNSKDE